MFRRSAITLLLMVACLTPALTALAQDGSGTGGSVEPLTSRRVASALNRPIGAFSAPEDYRRLYILEKAGVIKIYDIHQELVLGTPFLNVDPLVGGGTTNEDERGLLGLAFHPDYEKNGQFYINYTDNAGSTTISRYTVSADPNIANASGDILLVIAQPFQNHNGGWIDFSPNDGYLYIGMGDGGNACDPGNRAQDITAQLLGKMLRIDINADDFPADANRDYAIPLSNPFVGITGDDEIWAYGLRNPWRNAFDSATGDLYIADVGQGTWEEVNFHAAESTGGQNYGWDCMEGNACSSVSGCGAGACTCGSAALADPFQAYSHGGSPFRCSITGGYVYRGCDIPTLDGHYFYADYCSEQIWSLVYDGQSVSQFADRTAELDPPGTLSIDEVVSFGKDARGELYIMDQGTAASVGEVFQIIPVTPTVSPYDFNCDGIVSVSDMVDLILAWGACDHCQEDANGDFNVSVEDLVDLILDWG